MIDESLDNLDLFGHDSATDVSTGLASVSQLRMFRWEGTLRDMLDAVRLALRQQRIDEKGIDHLAIPVVIQLCTTIGGQITYVPRGASVMRALRDARLFDEWRWQGTKPPELATKYKIAVQTVYEIISRQRGLTRRNEPDLFGFEPRSD